MPRPIQDQESNSSNESVDSLKSFDRLIDDLFIVHVYPALDHPFICFLPQRVGFYSCRIFNDGQSHCYRPDKSSLTYLRPDWPFVENLDLLEGVILQKPLNRLLYEASHLFEWIYCELKPTAPLANVNFVFACSVILHNLLYLPYNANAFLSIYAIKMNKKIYLIRRDPNDFAKNGMYVSKEYMIRGYADMTFTDLMTLQENGSFARHVRGNRNSFYVINKLEVGQHRILYPHLMHCVTDVKQFNVPLEEMRFVEIKTRPRPGSYAQRPNQHVTRSISWWITSFLGGAEAIICGEKIARTKVERISSYQPDNLLHVRGKDPLSSWTPRVCIDSLRNSLTQIEAHCAQENVVYKILIKNQEKGLQIDEVSEIQPSVLIPSWYLNDPR